MELPTLTDTSPDHLMLNEYYGPTIQGEGPDIGRACLFIRTQHCPVQCPGCDSYYTWDGSESGKKVPLDYLNGWLNEQKAKYPGVGLVFTGGEPLLHYQNKNLVQSIFAFRYKNRSLMMPVNWAGIETSGFIGTKQISNNGALAALHQFLSVFSTICISPKVTPCLHGQFPDQELLVNFSTLLEICRSRLPGSRWCVKLVVKDEKDLEVATDLAKRHVIHPTNLYLMPYGIKADEVAESCRNQVPILAKTGFTLSPRLHTLLWGNTRAI